MTIPELPLERFAELSAELDAGVSREQVLAEAGLTPEVWAGTQEHWLGKIAAEATRKRFDLTTRYTKAISARRRRSVIRIRRLPQVNYSRNRSIS